MKTIYQRIGIILILGFVIQLVIVGIFYKQVIIKNVVAQVNLQTNNRQSILQEAAIAVEKNWQNSYVLQSEINNLSKAYNVSFTIKNTKGETLYFSLGTADDKEDLQLQEIIKPNNEEVMVIYGRFPSIINKLMPDEQQTRLRVIITAFALVVSVISSFLIYKVIASPLKKLSRAVNNIEYGSTLITIPYYEKDEVGLLCRNFESMGKRLKTSEENQYDLIQAISHDIKTPLTSIIGYSKRLKEGRVTEERKIEYYNTISRKAKDLEDLISELDEFALLNSVVKYDLTKVNAKDYFNQICEELVLEAEANGYNFQYNNFLKENLKINIDLFKLKRVFLNILNNSIKYSEDNCSVVCNCKRKDKFIVFELIDNGPGIPLELSYKIFSRFFRIETSRSREKGGTGLGLAICKEIISNHKGDIFAENIEPNGFKIQFEIPIASN